VPACLFATAQVVTMYLKLQTDFNDLTKLFDKEVGTRPR
jgi:hypothetical protein